MLHVSRREQIISSVIFSFILICRLHFSLLVGLDSAPKDRLHFNQSYAFFFFKGFILGVSLLTVFFCGKFFFFCLQPCWWNLLCWKLRNCQQVTDAITPKYTSEYLTGLWVTGPVWRVVMSLEAIVTRLTAVISVQEDETITSSLSKICSLWVM